MKKSVLAKFLSAYVVISLIVPANLFLALPANAQTKDPIIDTPPPQVETQESEPALPVFSVTPNHQPNDNNGGNNDNPPPKEIKINDSDNRIEPKDIKKVGDNQSPQDGEPAIESYKYAVANNASKADVNGLTGAFTYSIQLYTPPGRNGMEPSLSLNYSSQTKNELNWIGYGWDISIPSIQRMNKMGVYQSPTNNLYTADTFTSSLNGELATTSTTGVFNAKSDDGSFLKSTFSSSTNEWTVETKDGTIYKFGHSQDAQIYNSATTTEVYKWMLEEVRDLNGNYITYEYFQDAGYIYPDTITYTNDATSTGLFTVEFNRDTRSDTATSSEAGFPMTSNYRINQIVVSVDGEWVRKYDLTYTTGDNGRRSLLESVIESANDGSTTLSLPPTIFSYQESTPGWATTTTSFSLPEKFKIGYDDTGLRVADLNSDGLTDLIRSKEGITTTAWINNGEGWNLDANWIFPEPFIDNDGEDLGTRLADINGDGLVDVLRGEDWSTRRTHLHTGLGWATSTLWIPPVLTGSWGETGYRFVDINGDGLVDLLQSEWYPEYNYGNQSVRLNNGKGGWDNTSYWELPIAFINIWGSGVNRTLGVVFEDVNGDGLPDIITKDDDQVYDREGVYLNTGSGWSLEPSWQIPKRLGNGGSETGQNIIDVNGDNLPDIIDGTSAKDVYINNGSNWVLDNSWDLPLNFEIGDGYSAQISDVNGDGMSDIIQRNDNVHNRWLMTGKPVDVLTKIEESPGAEIDITYNPSAQYRDTNGDLLNPDLPFTVQVTESVTIEDGFGNTASEVEYTYSDGYFYFNNSFDKQFVGFGKMEKTDAEGNLTKTYFHQGNESASTTGEYNDHISKVGKPYRTEIYDDNGNLYSKTINKWESVNREGDAYFVKLIDSVGFTYDGDSDHKEKATRISYDDSTGNTTQQIEFGEVSGNDDGTFTDIGTDKFITNLSYATSTATSTVTKLSKETTIDNSGNKVREKKIYYDTLSFGNLNKGNPTKEEYWKSGSSYVDVERTFNSYGLVTQEKDPRDKITSYIYDQHNLYPATTTNPFSHVTERYYDYSSGQVEELIDPNGHTYQTIYDAFDRIDTEKQPSLGLGGIGEGFFGGGIGSGPSLDTKTKFVYTDNTFPRQVKRTDYLGSSLTVDSYFYFDGLNRKVEERVEAEDSNTFKVKDFEYDSRGLLVEESLPFFGTGTSYTGTSTPPATYLMINYSYDPLGRLTTLTNNVGSTTNSYDDWVVTTTDPNSSVKEYTKDAYNNLVQVEENNATSTYVTTYEWNGNKNLTKIIDAEGNVRNFTYDGLGRRLTAEDLHDTGDGAFGTWSYGYDDSGNLASSTDPKSQLINYTYDDLNRILTEDYVLGIGTEIQYGYDTCSNGTGYLCSATSTGAVQKFTYNVLGLPATETKTIDSIDYKTTYTYDRQGNITKVKTPDNAETSYTFNTAGLLEIIKKKEAGGTFVNVVSDFDYGPTDQVILKSFSNNVESAYTYDDKELYRLKNILTIASTTQGLRGDRDDSRSSLFAGIGIDLNYRLQEKPGIPITDGERNMITEETGFNRSGEMVYKSSFYGQDVQYIDPITNQRKKIDLTLMDKGNSWTMTKAPYGARLSKIVENKFITYRTGDTELYFSLGQSSGRNGSKISEEKILYESALGTGVDVEVSLDSTSLRKEFILNDLSSVDSFSRQNGLVNIPFILESNDRINLKNQNGELLAEKSFTSSEPVAILVGSETVAYIKPPIAIDSDRKAISIEIKYELTETGIRMTKHIPIDWLETASFPIRTDAIVSYYASITETSIKASGDSWDTIHDASSGVVNINWDKAQVGSHTSYIERAALSFDTSGLPDNASTTQATLKIYIDPPIDNYDNDGNDFIRVVQATVASSTSLSSEDYDQIGAIDNPTAGAEDRDITSLSGNQYNSFNLNDTGYSWINAVGYTNLGLREGHDVTDTPSNDLNNVQFYTSNHTGNNRDPVFIITYVLPTAPTPPTNLQVEERTNPTDIIDGVPEFSAIYNDPDDGDIALNYQIQISLAPDHWTSILWDSGKKPLLAPITEGARSEEISYGGDQLPSDTTYYWRIRFWDESDTVGAWSTTTSSFSISSDAISTPKYEDISTIGWTQFGSGAYIDISRPEALEEGDLMVAIIAVDTSTGSGPIDWTTIESEINWAQRVGLSVYGKIADENDAATTTYRFHGGDSAIAGSILQFKNASLEDIQSSFVYKSSWGNNPVTFSPGLTTGEETILVETFHASHQDYAYSNYGISNDNPVWTELVDLATNIDTDHMWSVAIANRTATTSTGDFFVSNSDMETRSGYGLILSISGSETTPEPNPEGSIQNISFFYDNVGNIVRIADDSQTEAEKNILFWYDDLHRMTAASTTAATSTPFRETYSYNSLGNITNKSDQGNYTYSETGYANPHAATSIGGTSLSYDNNGNLTSYNGISYTWDWRNRMKTAGSVNYYYDHTEQRVKETSGGVTTIIPNQYWDKEGATTTRHIYDDRGGLIATIEGDGTATSTYYIHTDHLGGTNVVTDSSGEVVEVTDYLPFGKINTNEAPTGSKTDRKFTSHVYDQSADLNYMNARYQDGNIGRFLSQDPAFQVVGAPELRQKTNLELDQYLSDPQLHNSYSYVRNNPLKHVDPTGEFIDTVVDIGFIALDLYKISQAVANGGDVRGELGSLGLDIAGAAIPGVTGLGMMKRVGSKADEIVDLASSVNKFDPSNPGLAKLGEARSIMLDGVQNEKLQRIINQNYRKFSEVGNGSSMDALLKESVTGKPVGRRGFHATKIENDMRGLRDVLKMDISRNDRAKAHYMLKYMQESRKFFRKTRNQ